METPGFHSRWVGCQAGVLPSSQITGQRNQRERLQSSVLEKMIPSKRHTVGE